jgi:transcription initiation factor IIE alpha subunit
MRRPVIDETLEQVEKLVNELQAISHWDAEYQRDRSPEWYETVAYVSRQKRRREIMRQLLRTSRRWNLADSA